MASTRLPRKNKSITSKSPDIQPFVYRVLADLRGIKSHVSRIAEEGATFVSNVHQAQFAEELNKLDKELARRERIFGKLQVSAIVEFRCFVRLQRARGRLHDLRIAIVRGQRYSLEIQQLAKKKGYLTETPTIIRVHRTPVYDRLARAIWESSRDIRRNLPYFLIVFYMRYLIDVVRRNSFRVFISVGILVLGIAMAIEAGHLSVLGWGGVVLISTVIVGWIFEKLFHHRWGEIHRRAIGYALVGLYCSFLKFVVARACLDAGRKFIEEAQSEPQSAASQPPQAI